MVVIHDTGKFSYVEDLTLYAGCYRFWLCVWMFVLVTKTVCHTHPKGEDVISARRVLITNKLSLPCDLELYFLIA